MSLVRLFSTALDINTINSHAEVFESCPNYWIPRKALEANDVHTAVEREVCRLFHDVMQDILPTDWAGAEFWIQARPPVCRELDLQQVPWCASAVSMLRFMSRAKAWRSTLTRMSSCIWSNAKWSTRSSPLWSTLPATRARLA